MTLHTLDTGLFKLDGGAMFGVVPKSMWQKAHPADEANMCTWALRCLLLEHEGKLILVDTGIGDKQDAKFRSHFYLHGDATLLGSLAALGIAPGDITDVLLTHLHFDHVGGAVTRVGEQLLPTFPNAIYHTNRRQWEWAIHPNPREKASFLAENILPLQEAGQLRFVEDVNYKPFGDAMELLLVDGHTEQMMLPLFEAGGRQYFFCADLVPSFHHIPLPWIMGYDMRPLETLTEKQRILSRCLDEGITLLFEHDHVTEQATLERTERGIRGVR